MILHRNSWISKYWGPKWKKERDGAGKWVSLLLTKKEREVWCILFAQVWCIIQNTIHNVQPIIQWHIFMILSTTHRTWYTTSEWGGWGPGTDYWFLHTSVRDPSPTQSSFFLFSFFLSRAPTNHFNWNRWKSQKSQNFQYRFILACSGLQ